MDNISSSDTVISKLNGKLDIFMEEIDVVCKGTKSKILKMERKFFKNHLPHMQYAKIKNDQLPLEVAKKKWQMQCFYCDLTIRRNAGIR